MFEEQFVRCVERTRFHAVPNSCPRWRRTWHGNAFARRRGTAHDTRRRVPTGNRRLCLSSSKIHRVHALNVASCHGLLDTATLIASRARLRAGVDEELGVLHRRGSSETAGSRGRSGGPLVPRRPSSGCTAPTKSSLATPSPPSSGGTASPGPGGVRTRRPPRNPCQPTGSRQRRWICSRSCGAHPRRASRGITRAHVAGSWRSACHQ